MSVRARLLLTFGLVTGVMLVPSLFAASRISTLRDIAIEGRTNHARAVVSLGRMQGLLTDLDRLERSFAATGDPELGRTAAARIDSLRRTLEAFRSSPYGDLAAPLVSSVDQIESLGSTVDAHVGGGRLAEATYGVERLLPRLVDAARELEAVAGSVDGLARAELARADRMTLAALTQTLLGVVAAVLLAIVFTGLTTHRLTEPLRRLSRAMAGVADGRLEAPANLPYDRPDELGDLAASFGIMTRRLSDLDKKKSEFLGMVSHELKTPINVIAAYAEILHEDLRDLPDYHANMVRDVMEQAQGMARQASRLMDLSRLEAGTYQLQPDPVKLECFMADVARTFRRLADDKGILLTTTVSEGLPEEVVMDGDIVRDEVLGNLILNGIRYTPEGGRVEVSLHGDDHGICFVVADTGPGIPEEHREHIFRKHYVADRTRLVGSGLGLAIAKEMVELHGGIILLEDTPPSAGARFRVALPLRPGGPGIELPAPSFFDHDRDTETTRATQVA